MSFLQALNSFRSLHLIVNSLMSVISDFSLSDTVTVSALEMSDDDTKPEPTFEKEGSLNSSMITVIVGLQASRHCVQCLKLLFYRSTTSTFVSILISSKENRRH